MAEWFLHVSDTKAPSQLVIVDALEYFTLVQFWLTLNPNELDSTIANYNVCRILKNTFIETREGKTKKISLSFVPLLDVSSLFLPPPPFFHILALPF